MDHSCMNIHKCWTINCESSLPGLMSSTHSLVLTVSNEEEEPPFLGKFAENHDKHEVKHHSLAHHPAESRQEQILKQSCHCSANNLWNRNIHAW